MPVSYTHLDVYKRQRLGNSNQIIAALLETRENIIQTSILSVLDCFRKNVLQEKFGIQAHTREDFLREAALAVCLLYDFDNSKNENENVKNRV